MFMGFMDVEYSMNPCWNTVGVTPGTNWSSDLTFSFEIRNKQPSFNNLSFYSGAKNQGHFFSTSYLISSMKNIMYIKTF